jgi:hypothetical protein
VTLVDSAESVALAVLNSNAGGASSTPPGLEGSARVEKSSEGQRADIRFFVTDSVEKFKRLGARFLGREIVRIEHIDLKE